VGELAALPRKNVKGIVPGEGIHRKPWVRTSRGCSLYDMIFSTFQSSSLTHCFSQHTTNLVTRASTNTHAHPRTPRTPTRTPAHARAPSKTKGPRTPTCTNQTSCQMLDDSPPPCLSDATAHSPWHHAPCTVTASLSGAQWHSRWHGGAYPGPNAELVTIRARDNSGLATAHARARTLHATILSDCHLGP
jgi:hypothetical protein